MKVGLLTIHNTANFGSTLQAYASWKAIESMGCDCEIIDYTCDNILKKENGLNFKDVTSIKKLFRYLTSDRKKKIKLNAQRSFLRKNAKFTPTFTKKELPTLNNDFNKIIVGSDIVWGEKNFKNDFSYFLDFVNDDVMKVSFSSSIGDKWTQNENEIINLLLRFDYISVREETSAKWLSSLLNRNVDFVCDPTMLFKSEDWLELFDSKKRIIKEPYILVYFNDKNGNNLKNAVEYGKKHNVAIYFINFGRKYKGTKSIKPIKVEEFLNLIYFAEVVFSASYHGLLFSLYFNKEVFYYNRGFSERMNALAKTLDIEYREQTPENILQDKSIDYQNVSKNIDQFRLRSLKILRNNILGLEDN